MNQSLVCKLILWAILSSVVAAPAGYAQDSAGQKTLAANVGYYFIAKAEVNAGSFHIWGASNLPAGSVLAVAILTHIGQGGERLNNENAEIAVDKNGAFSASLPPRKGTLLKGNMVCVLSFHPNLQPARITGVVGDRGERLGDSNTNPEIGTYSGGHYLVSYITVIGGHA